MNMVNTSPKDIMTHPENANKSAYYKGKCRDILHCYLPITKWLPHYSFYNLQCDLIAGVTVGLMVIPQGLAYASIANLPHSYGLYSSFMGCFIYCLFGTSKDITIGPTAILSLMVVTYNFPHCGEMAVVLTFLVGLILLLMGIFHLGFIVRFVSVPVISGFTSAAAITIACGQLKSLNGLKHVSREFFPGLVDNFKQIKHWNYYDVAYGVICILILFGMRLLSRLNWQDPALSRTRSICYKVLWLFGISRNALLVILSCCLVYILKFNNVHQYFTLIENEQFGLPSFQAPLIHKLYCYTDIKVSNKTEKFSFDDTLGQFSTGLAIVPLLAFMEAVAIGKAFSRVNNYKIIPNQELIALGMANIFGSFVSSYPVTGSFSRTAVNSQSGVRTPLSGIFTGTIVIFAIQFLSGVFQYIPKACLGAVIMSAVINMVDYEIVRSLWRIKRLDLIPFFVTFLACFYELEIGLILGILISILFILYPVVNPKITEDIKEITILKLHNGLSYAGIDKIMEKVEDIICKPNPPIAIILDMSGVVQIDFSVVIGIRELLSELQTRLPGTELLVTKTCFEVKRVLILAGLHDIITSPENVSERYQEGQRLLYD